MHFFEKQITFIVSAIALSIGVSAENIKNGSFENGNPGKRPNEWFFGTHGGAECTMAITTSTAHSGKKSLKIVNKSIHKAQVYGSLIQNPRLIPGRRYELSCYVKGKNVNELIFILGNRWKLVKVIEPIEKEWTKFSTQFTADHADCGKNGNFMVRINSNSIVEEAYIDDVSLTEVDAVSQKDFQKNHLYVMKKFNSKLKDLKTIPSELLTFELPLNKKFYKGKYVSKLDLSCKMAWAWDDKGLIFLADVTDDKIKSFKGSNMWMGDCIQFRIDQKGTLAKGEHPDDIELGFAPEADGKIQSWNWMNGRSLNTDEAEVYGGTTSRGYWIAARLNWKMLPAIDFNNKHNFSVNAIINECDKEGVREVAFLAPGIHTEKSGEENTLMLFDTGKPIIEIVGSADRFKTNLDGKLLAHGYEAKGPWTIDGELTDSAGKKHNFKIDGIYPLKKDQVAAIDYGYSLKNVANGPFSLKFSVGKSFSCAMKGRKADIVKSVAVSINKSSQKLDALSKEIAKHPEITSLYLTAPLAELKYQAALVKSDMKKCKDKKTTEFYASRAEKTCREITEGIALLQNRFQEAVKSGKKEATWSYVTSKSTLKNGWMYSEAINQNGNKEYRPIFFAGYGHFDTAQKDIPLFQKIGANVIQREVGIYHVMKGFDKEGNGIKFDTAKLENNILKPLENAWKHNVKLCVLLGTHYFPKAIMKMFPEMKQNSGMFKFDVNHPVARKVVEQFLRKVIPLIKNSPYHDAVHSICLSNEPAYKGATLKHQYTQKLFTAWLKKKYPNIAEFNRISHNNFKDYAAILKAGYDNPAVKYEFSIFKRETFAGWHAWMAGIIREMWPEVSLHAKIMVFDSLCGAALESAADPELFAALSDMNGNDNYCLYGQGRWASNWKMIAIYHDLQRSMKKTMAVNTENHVIKDGENQYIPYEHLYTATFQQFMFGVGTIVTWVWHDVDYNLYNKIDALRGNIFRRPIDVIAQSDATLDGNRLAKEIIAFCDVEPEVKIIYSPTSYIQDTDKYCLDIHNLYESLSFCGNKLGFISEKQLEAGDFKQTRMIFAPSVKYIRKAALKKLTEFVQNGGKVITIGESFKYDRFGKPLGMQIKNMNLPDNLIGRNYVEALKKQVYAVCKPKVSVLFNGKPDTYGLLWRAADTPYGYLINVVNYTKKSGKISFPQSVKAVDLISGKDVSKGTKINSLKPMLIKVEF